MDGSTNAQTRDFSFSLRASFNGNQTYSGSWGDWTDLAFTLNNADSNCFTVSNNKITLKKGGMLGISVSLGIRGGSGTHVIRYVKNSASMAIGRVVVESSSTNVDKTVTLVYFDIVGVNDVISFQWRGNVPGSTTNGNEESKISMAFIGLRGP